ncbi:hypothetical protein [Cohnella sp. CFH 77786]|nr:hypothetical protein [Cohnella sp. CFH 77786]
MNRGGQAAMARKTSRGAITASFDAHGAVYTGATAGKRRIR